MPLYLIGSGPMQTTAKFAALATGTSIKTLLQVKPGATSLLRIVEWGIHFDGSLAATGISVELIETDVAATVTASVANDITKIDGDALAAGDPTTNIFSVGTSATGYNSSAEGSTTAVRNLDTPLFLQPTGPFIKQFPLGDEPIIQPGKFARIRVHAPAGVNAVCYMKIRA